MKQILSAFLILCLLLFPVSSLGNFYFSTMTDEELKQFIVLAQAELYSRQEKADEAALKKDGVLSIKETGFLKYDDMLPLVACCPVHYLISLFCQSVGSRSAGAFFF